MLKSLLKILGYGLALVVVVVAILVIFRSDPLGPLAGRKLSGPEQAYPTDWAFSNDHTTIALETRPDDPHSVTTICFTKDGALYVPAQGGSEKKWTQYVLDDPRVRLKIGDNVYPGRAARILEVDEAALIEAASGKYSQIAESDFEVPDDMWLFRIDPPTSAPSPPAVPASGADG